MMMLLWVMLPTMAWCHGYFFAPASRQRQAHEEQLDYCPHCSLASGMKALNPQGPWPGTQPFAEPGTAPSLTKVENGQDKFGVCGTQKLGTHNYNYVNPGHWGDTVVATMQQGEVIDVEWCVNADHGGVYWYRLCYDQCRYQV